MKIIVIIMIVSILLSCQYENKDGNFEEEKLKIAYDHKSIPQEIENRVLSIYLPDPENINQISNISLNYVSGLIKSMLDDDPKHQNEIERTINYLRNKFKNDKSILKKILIFEAVYLDYFKRKIGNSLKDNINILNLKEKEVFKKQWRIE